MEEEKDVTVESSTTEQEEVQASEPSDVSQSESTEVEVVKPEPSGVEKPKESPYVPYDRFKEVISEKQKYQDELYTLKSSLPEMLKKAVAEVVPSQDSRPKYTKDELIRFKNNTDNAEHRAWAEIELEKVRSEETRKFFDAQLERQKQEEAINRAKQDALYQVQRLYPMAFKDGGWDNNHPLTQKIAQIYNSDTVFQNHGYGLLSAAKMAFADYILEQQPEITKKQTKMKQTIKKLEKATLVEGNGVSNVPAGKSEIQKAMEQFSKTGSEEDLVALLKAKQRAASKS